jgi:hypothetical protein
MPFFRKKAGWDSPCCAIRVFTSSKVLHLKSQSNIKRAELEDLTMENI